MVIFCFMEKVIIIKCYYFFIVIYNFINLGGGLEGWLEVKSYVLLNSIIFESLCKNYITLCILNFEGL